MSSILMPYIASITYCLTSDMPAGLSMSASAPVAVARCASPMPIARTPTKSSCADADVAAIDNRRAAKAAMIKGQRIRRG